MKSSTDERVEVHVGAKAPSSIAPPVQTLLTGRDTEVSLLRDQWEQVQEGRGMVVAMVGEAGLGKSRLVEAIKDWVTDQYEDALPGTPAAIVEWRCALRSQNSDLFPVAEYLSRSLVFQGQESTSEKFDRLARSLDGLGLGTAEVVSLFAKLLFLAPDERYPATGLSPFREREETFAVLRQWLTAYAAKRPILFVVEDLHWADASTLEFLTHFLREEPQGGILTVLTFRPEFRLPLQSGAHVTTLALNRLTRRQISQLVEASSTAPIPKGLMAQIVDRTGGVPLLIEEFARIVLCGAPDQALPETLQDLVLSRLDRMGSNREVVQLAATLGREFAYEFLASISPVQGAALMLELEKLVEADILSATGEAAGGTYRFKHALLEEALYESVGLEDRRRLHRLVAETMEASPDVVQRQPELVAQHLAGAGMTLQAVKYRLAAGLRCQERFANAEAISHLTEGLALLRSLETSPERDALELDLLRPLGMAYIATRGYAAPEVGPVFDRAVKLCAGAAETPQVFATTWGNFAFHVVRGNFRLCADLAEEAIAIAERLDDDGMRMEALFLRGLTMFYRGDFIGARDTLSRALGDYDNQERRGVWAALVGQDCGVTTRCYLALAYLYLGLAERAEKMIQEAIACAREVNHPFSLAYALHHQGWLHRDSRRGSLAVNAADELLQVSAEQGFPFWRATGTLYRAAGLLLLGHRQQGCALLEEGLQAYRATGAGLALPYHLGALSEALIGEGRYSEAAKALEEALAIGQTNDDHFHKAELLRLKGELLLAAQGDQAGAEECFQRGLAIAQEQQSRTFELRTAVSLARLWCRQRKARQAHALLAPVHGAFTEGLALPDVMEAAALLKDLRNERMHAEFAAGEKYVRDCIPAPLLGDVSVNWRYVPASTLGGDMIGYHWVDEQHLAFYLIDVTGHGLDSALLSVSISNVLRSGSVHSADLRSPSQVLSALNETFEGRKHGGKFFTIWYGVYQPLNRTLTWAGGGHNPALLFSPGLTEPQQLPASGPMMGIQSAEFPSASCVVAPGSRMLIFSDGVYEIRRDRRAVFNLETCASQMATFTQHDDVVLDNLLNHVRELRGSAQLDDDFSIIEATFN